MRINYYGSFVGSDEKLLELQKQVQSIEYHYFIDFGVRKTGYLCPRFFKKLQRAAKSHKVDINITIDMLTHAVEGNFDDACLVSGDGDFVPLVEEIKRRGRRVHVWYLSEGLKPELLIAADAHKCLDTDFFWPHGTESCAADTR